MAAPPTQASSPLVAGLLQSLAPWMTGANPSALDNSFQQYGGTTGLLSAMLQDAPGSQGAANFGKALQGVQSDALQRAAARQQLASQNIGLQQNLAMFPYFMGALRQYGGGVAPSQAPAAPAATAPSADSSDEQPQGAAGASVATPAGAHPSAAPAAAPGPHGGGPNLASGLNLARVMALMNRPGADTFLRSITADPAYITQSKLAGDPLVIDQAEMAQAAQSKDPQAYLSAYTKYLTDANRLHISSMSGNVTGFGLPPWVLQSMVGYNPQTGKLTANGRQDLIPGAASTEAALAAAREGAETAARVANTPINIPTGGGGSTFNYPGSVIGMPPALRGAGGASAPRAAPSQATPASSVTPSVPKGTKDVWSTVPKLNVPQNTGEADFFTQGRLRAAGEADIKLSSELGEDAATADQQLEYNREAMRELPTAEAGPMSNMLTHFRSAFIELGVPEGLIPKGGSVVPTQELNKSLKNAALQGARELYGSRMTQTEVKLQTEEMSPSSSMMKDAISSLIKQNNIRLMYSKAKAADYQVYRDHGGDPTRYDSWYATTFPIQKFAQAAEKAMQ